VGRGRGIGPGPEVGKGEGRGDWLRPMIIANVRTNQLLTPGGFDLRSVESKTPLVPSKLRSLSKCLPFYRNKKRRRNYCRHCHR